MFAELPADVRAVVWKMARFLQGRAVVGRMLAAKSAVVRGPHSAGVVLQLAAGKTLALTVTAGRKVDVHAATEDLRRVRLDLMVDECGRVSVVTWYRTLHWRLTVPCTPGDVTRPRASLSRRTARRD